MNEQERGGLKYTIGVRKKKSGPSSVAYDHFDVRSAVHIPGSFPNSGSEISALALRLGDAPGESVLGGVAAQDDLERLLMLQVDERLRAQDDAADQKRLRKTAKEISDLKTKIQTQSRRLGHPSTPLAEKHVIRDQLQELRTAIAHHESELAEIRARLSERERDAGALSGASSLSSALHPKESERERLIREGKITPFQSLDGFTRSINNDDTLRGTNGARDLLLSSSTSGGDSTMTPRSSVRPLAPAPPSNIRPLSTASSPLVPQKSHTRQHRPHKRRIILASDDSEEEGDESHNVALSTSGSTSRVAKRRRQNPSNNDDDSFGSSLSSADSTSDDDSASASDSDKSASDSRMGPSRLLGAKDFVMYADDGDESVYRSRMVRWCRARQRARAANNDLETLPARDTDSESESEDVDTLLDSSEPFLPDPTYGDHALDARLTVPGDVWRKLLDYQKTGVRWLWELRRREVGGLVGDEMGLGKTIQIIAHLSSLHRSRLLDGPVLVLCPATVLRQWVQEFHKWWPPMRVAVLHASGSVMEGSSGGREGGLGEDDFFSEEESDKANSNGRRRAAKKGFAKGRGIVNGKVAALVERIRDRGHVLVTTYTSAQIHRDVLLPIEWTCAVLDEGHKIRNPDADITLVCKQLRTPHRLILSGTPIQNNLTELWSLFDFVFPGRLGTLPVFQSQFSVPIRLGGYANASNMEVQTAYRCATVLRDLIAPYMLRRMKADVAHQLPGKSEQVLFCRLTEEQRDAYKKFLGSKEVEAIFGGRKHVLYGIDYLRKICNHPDLIDRKEKSGDSLFGDSRKSGKMKVLKALLEMWREGDHKVLLFCQTRQMLDILERFVKGQGFKYRRMDGETAIKNRMTLVDEFNSDHSIYIFLLTTKVGGLGINLTGADRVVIFDPDWNPSTDVQARERAWRLGQKREVTIYRLMTSGTIEEKIYHRQIFKQFLTNKILKDPKQRRFFKANDLHDLFSLSSGTEKQTETGELFRDMDMDVEIEVTKDKANSQRGSKRRPGRTLNDINDVEKTEEYRSPVDEAAGEGSKVTNQGKRGTSGEPDEDSRILKSLFERTGVHSALKHDVIMDSSNPEYVIVEKEASKIAERAIAALRESRRQRRRADVSVPTWTGNFGAAGGPVGQNRPPKRFGNRLNMRLTNGSVKAVAGDMIIGSTFVADTVSSTAILANLQEPKIGDSAFSNDVDFGGSSRGATFANLAEEISDHITRCGGRVATSDIVDAFKTKIPDGSGGEGVLAFKKILKELATLEKDASGKGWWILKQDFSESI
ncbi:hypothetical protein HDU93_008153 [Gonapodya sp. JEL0774]|nr:hypothetical protein HDU93_008153 [Gonapodya sp. JEL0774]